MRFTLIQVGDNLDLDITQDGQNNKVGTDPTDMTLSGDDMTFAITQTGNTNSIRNPIKGTDYTGTWTFTGDPKRCRFTMFSALQQENVTL